MPEIQEFEVQSPSLMIETFFVALPGGDDWQTWERRLLAGDQVEFFYEVEGAWLPATIDSWYIDDGSGNAPGANAHFFLKVERGGKKYKLDLDGGIRVRLLAPTRAELVAAPKRCEGITIAREGGRYHNEEWGPCPREGIKRLQGSWYCESCYRAQLQASIDTGLPA